MDAGDPDIARMVTEEEANAAIARQIYALRMRHKMTQAQLAERIGTRQPVIARLEDADYTGHSLSMLSRIAEALGYTITVRFVPRAPLAAVVPAREKGHRTGPAKVANTRARGAKGGRPRKYARKHAA